MPVAYKSDHGEEATNAKYLLFQAAGAHSFGLPAELAMQAVTSVPARSIQQDHRIGYVKPGYDADLVMWDAHPLSVGATPISVFIDGHSALPESKTTEILAKIKNPDNPQSQTPQMRPMLESEERKTFCSEVQNPRGRLVVTGISKSYVDLDNASDESNLVNKNETMTMILSPSQGIVCLGRADVCIHDAATDTVIGLKDGHVLPGLTAVTTDMGLIEIAAEDSTSDGDFTGSKDILDPSNIVYAKYGVHLEGKGFQRARIGGVTRAITSPLSASSLLRGVSTGIKTTGNKTVLDGGIFQDDVALHFVVGQSAKGASTSKSDPGPRTTVSGAIATLRRILFENRGKDSIYGAAADGSLPVVVHAVNKYDIMQLIKLKQDYSKVKLAIMGGHEAHAVAAELAGADIPLIFTGHRGAPDAWEKKDVLPGPPLSRSGASVLVENNVSFAIGFSGEGESCFSTCIQSFAFCFHSIWRACRNEADVLPLTGAPIGQSFIHNLLLEAAWAAKYAGLSDRQAVGLVSRNVEDILGLERSSDIVVYEGNPLEFGASVVLALDGRGNVDECWPEAT